MKKLLIVLLTILLSITSSGYKFGDKIITDTQEVEVRKEFENLGYKVEWNSDTKNIDLINAETAFSLNPTEYEIVDGKAFVDINNLKAKLTVYKAFDISLYQPTHEFFYTQQDTGSATAHNCMVTVLSMVNKLYDESYDKTVEQLREESFKYKDGEGLSIKDVKEYSSNEVPFTDEKLDEIEYSNSVVVVGVNTKMFYEGKKGDTYHALLVLGTFKTYLGYDMVAYINPSFPKDEAFRIALLKSFERSMISTKLQFQFEEVE